MTYWGLVITRANQERIALNNVQRQGFVAYLPLFRETAIRQGRLTSVVRVLFPRYMFVQIEGQWSSLGGTFGVSAVLVDGVKPRKVSDRIVDDIRSGQDADGFVVVGEEDPDKLVPGRAVMVGSSEGALWQRAIFQGMRGDDRAAVLLKMLGSERTIVVPRNLLTAA